MFCNRRGRFIKGKSLDRNMESDARYHPDFATDHLKRGTKTVARKIRSFLNEKAHGGLLADGDWHSGCSLFCNDFSYAFGGGDRPIQSRDAHGELFLVFDGGLLYDFLSPNGDAEYMGHGWEWPFTQFCNRLGYDVECVTSYCLSVTKQ